MNPIEPNSNAASNRVPPTAAPQIPEATPASDASNNLDASISPPASRRQFLLGSAVLAGAALLDGDPLRAVAAPSETDSNSVAAKSLAAPLNSPVAPSQAMGELAPIFNRAPLAPAPFGALPLGSVRARGWLLTQLHLQRDGLTGHAEELFDATQPNSAWKGGDGEDWEKGPYYLKGLVALAYTLDDAALQAKVRAWIEPILASQRPDGFFGPTKNDDWWPRMVATYLLRDYAEATGDARVAPFLTRYYRHMSANLPARPLREWGRARAGDEIDTVLWLYNRTGDAALLPLADLLHSQAYPWREIFTNNRFLENGGDIMTSHNVNVPQALKMPAVYFQKSHDAADKTAYYAGIDHLMRDHGTSFGIENGTEMLSGRASFEGVETCSIVEKLLSDETALRVFGDPKIGDAIEFVAFNALPAALSKDFRQHVYFTLANNVTAPRGGVGYEQNYGDGRTPAPRSGFPCCCYNLHMGWPKLAQNAWAATPDGGLAALYYLPSQVNTKLGAAQISVVCETNYPFEETIALTVSTSQTARFPLQLRVPAWCQNPQIRVNGQLQKAVAGGTFARLERAWKNGDRVEMRFPMSVQTVRQARGALDTVSLHHGPLLFALPLQETWTPFDKAKVPGFESYEVTSQTPWNFALALDGAGAVAMRRQSVGAGASAANSQSAATTPISGKSQPVGASETSVFATGKSPILLQVRARRVPGWTLQPNGLAAFDPPPSPVLTSAPLETLELVPFGSQMLRVTDFPVAATGAAMSGAAAAMPRSFRADFSAAHADAWMFYGGGWVVREGALRPDQHRGTGHAVAPRAVFSDFNLRAHVTPGATGNAGLTFRVNGPHLGSDAYVGYYLGLSAQNGQVQLGRADGKWHDMASAPFKMAAGESVPLRIEARGAGIRVWVGPDALNPAAAPLLLATAAPEAPATGAIGVRYYGQSANQQGAAFADVFVDAI